MKKYILFLFVLADFSLNSQIVPFTVNLDTSLTRTLDSALIYVKNPSSLQVNVIQTRVTSPFFFTRVNTFSVNPNDSTPLWVLFSSYHNLTYNSFLVFDVKVPNGGLKYSLVYGVIATAKYPDAVYSFSQGLSDEPLKSALKTFTTTGYISLGYNAARDRMFETVDDYGGDTIECVYTGRKIHAVTRTEAQNQNFNTEHTWPQSNFNENEPMRSDIHHLFPTDETANTYRSNYPFGYVVSNITWQVGGSKLGRDIHNSIVFEPRNVHKGNAARAVFYFVIRHQNYGSFLTLNQETALRQFHSQDTVDAREKIRSDRIKQFQNNRNPFADHPEFIERIRTFYTASNTPPKAEITAAPYNVYFDTLANSGDTVSYYVSILNYGNTDLNISGVSSSNSVFTVESYPVSVSPNRYGYAKIKFTPNAVNQTFTGELTINNSDSAIKVNLTGVSGEVIGINPVSSVIPQNFSLEQNYPNPFNPSTIIKFAIPGTGSSGSLFTSLRIFDVTGKEIAVLVNSGLGAGNYEVIFKASGLPSGIYFYRLTAGEFSYTRKMILVR